MKIVDLVVYKDGVRKVIGVANVNEEGLVLGDIQVHDEVTLSEVLRAGNVFGTSLGPFREYKES